VRGALSTFLAPDVEGPSVPRDHPPSFSVCVTAYQASSFIADGLTSLYEQTVPPYEVIVCDDGSTDDLDTALAPFRDRLTLVRQENRGPSAARNSAVARATGEFVVLLDADDRFDPRRLERLGALAMDRPDLDILTTDAFVEVNGTIVKRFYTATLRFETDDQRIGILASNFLFGLTAIRRSALLNVGGFDESLLIVGEDWECWMRLVLGGARAGLVNEPLAIYRVRSGSGSSNRVRLLEGRIYVLERALARSDLSRQERRVAEDAVAKASWMLAVAKAQRALVAQADDARARSLHVMVARGVPVRTRIKSTIGVVAPRATGQRLRRRRDRLSNDPAALLAERE
jgi:GT2 family glycosyltransferase